ncbi:hypothetical protein [Streptomyces sp. NPDC001970]
MSVVMPVDAVATAVSTVVAVGSPTATTDEDCSSANPPRRRPRPWCSRRPDELVRRSSPLAASVIGSVSAD